MVTSIQLPRMFGSDTTIHSGNKVCNCLQHHYTLEVLVVQADQAGLVEIPDVERDNTPIELPVQCQVEPTVVYVGSFIYESIKKGHRKFQRCFLHDNKNPVVTKRYSNGRIEWRQTLSSVWN